MTTVTAPAKSLFDFDWDAFLKTIEEYGFVTLSPDPPDQPDGSMASVNLIAAHPILKLLLHARSRVEYVDGHYVVTIGSAQVYGIARLRDDLPEIVQPSLRVSESWPTAVESCRSFRLSVRTGLHGIENLQADYEFVSWFQAFPINLLSYAEMNPFGGVSADDRYARKAFLAFMSQDALPSWFVDFAFPYRDLREWNQQ